LKIPDFLLRWIGRTAADKIGLQEGKMDGTKKWWTSKGMWTGVVTCLLGIYGLVSVTIMPAIGHAPLPEIPAWVLTFLGAMGLYSRGTATDKIG
jgi:hypothetical protein